MITAIIVIALLVVLVVTIRLVSKSLYRQRKPNHAIHTENRVRAKAASPVVNTTTP